MHYASQSRYKMKVLKLLAFQRCISNFMMQCMHRAPSFSLVTFFMDGLWWLSHWKLRRTYTFSPMLQCSPWRYSSTIWSYWWRAIYRKLTLQYDRTSTSNIFLNHLVMKSLCNYSLILRQNNAKVLALFNLLNLSMQRQHKILMENWILLVD